MFKTLGKQMVQFIKRSFFQMSLGIHPGTSRGPKFFAPYDKFCEDHKTYVHIKSAFGPTFFEDGGGRAAISVIDQIFAPYDQFCDEHKTWVLCAAH